MIVGIYFAPDASRPLPAQLFRREAGFAVQLQSEGLPFDVQIVSLAPPLGNAPRKIYFADGGMFEASADAPFSAMGLEQSGHGLRIARFEKNIPGIVLAAMLTLGSLFGFWMWGLPALSRFAASITPTQVIAVMDRGTLETVENVLFEPSQVSAARQQEIARLFDRLVVHAQTGGLRPVLLFRHAPRLGANAIALPGGSIIVTDALVGLAQNDAEIAGVLAHELAHVEGRHSLRQIYSALGISLMAGLIGGDPGGLVDSVVSQAGALYSLSYSRAFEAEADRRAVELMTAIGEDPVAFVALLERITARSGAGQENSIFATHPGMRERRDAVSGHATSPK